MDTENQNAESTASIIKDILEKQVQCVLATQHNGELFQHLMAYATDEDGAHVYFASFGDTQKVNNMRSDPNVSLLWDNRTGNNRDHVEGFALSAQGIAAVLDTQQPEYAKVRQRLLARNDTLSAMLNRDGSVLIEVLVQRYHLALGYTKSLHHKP